MREFASQTRPDYAPEGVRREIEAHVWSSPLGTLSEPKSCPPRCVLPAPGPCAGAPRLKAAKTLDPRGPAPI
jgi:hypothetical protein